jgi:hypothetical protein
MQHPRGTGQGIGEFRRCTKRGYADFGSAPEWDVTLKRIDLGHLPPDDRPARLRSSFQTAKLTAEDLQVRLAQAWIPPRTPCSLLDIGSCQEMFEPLVSIAMSIPMCEYPIPRYMPDAPLPSPGARGEGLTPRPHSLAEHAALRWLILGLAEPNSVSLYQRRYPDMPRPAVNLGLKQPLLWVHPEIERCGELRRDARGAPSAHSGKRRSITTQAQERQHDEN